MQVVRALPGGTALLKRFYMYEFRTADLLPKLRSPILLVHGMHDLVIPFQHSLGLLSVGATSGERRSAFLLLQGCDHVHAIFEPRLLEQLRTFFFGVSLS